MEAKNWKWGLRQGSAGSLCWKHPEHTDIRTVFGITQQG